MKHKKRRNIAKDLGKAQPPAETPPPPPPVAEGQGSNQCDAERCYGNEDPGRHTQWRFNPRFGVTEILSALLILITGAYVFVSHGQLLATKDILVETKRSTDLVKQQLVVAQRAYVFGYGVFGEILQTPAGKIIRLRVGIENSGNTPTKNMNIWANWQFLNGLIPKGFDFPDLDETGKAAPARLILTLLPPKQRVGSTIVRDITESGVRAINEQKAYLYAWGWVRYHDVFPDTVQHTTLFCYRVSRIDPSVAADHCEEHNCTDEDCDKAGSHR